LRAGGGEGYTEDMRARSGERKSGALGTLGILGGLALAASLFLNVFLYQKTKKMEAGILVIEVLDGDTFLLDGKVRVRLRHADAPELSFCGGAQAKKLLTNLVKEKKVVLQEQILDQYGRPLALIYAGNTLVNLEMLKSGWARYHHDNSSQKSVLEEAAAAAQKEARGIFSPLCHQKENRENPACQIKGNIDKRTGLKKYFFPGCAQYDFAIVEKDIGEAWFCREEEAQKAGFTRAETCPKGQQG